MKIMNEYTYEHIKKNKRHTVSILVAITIASSLLCSLCIFIYSIWNSKVQEAISETGYWQGEITKSISGDKLKEIKDNKSVKEAMVKGTWVTAKLQQAKRPYFLMRDADESFWSNMNFKDNLLDGRLPISKGEIVVSKLFFQDNPEYKLGDTLTLPIGNRMLKDKVLDTQSYKTEGETFKTLDSRTYTIVGELDVSGISAFPGYVAMGYLDDDDITAEDELTVYLNFKNPRNIYKDLPELLKNLGLEDKDYDKHDTLYNTKLLTLYGISDKNSTNIQFVIVIAMAAVIIMLVMGAFILIIYNAFALSANNRVRELSIFKGVGATPSQIKSSVLYEGFILWLLQIPIGIILGYAFSIEVFFKINEILSLTEDYQNMHVSISWIVVIFSACISLITVLVSAYIPARKAAKVPAILGMRQSTVKVRKQKNYFIVKKLFGFEGELAKVQLYANKKSLRTAVLSLAMCFVLIVGYLSIISIYNLAEYKYKQEVKSDISVSINTIDEPSNEMIKKITSIPEIKDSVIKRQVRTANFVTSDDESEIFKSLGGFGDVDYKYNVEKDNGQYRIIVNLIGLNNESFKKYCESINTDYKKYYEEDSDSGILINSSYHTKAHTNETVKIPLLNTKEGSIMHLYEKVENDMDTDYNFDINIGAVTDEEPTDFDGGRYSLNLVIPMDKYKKIVGGFSNERSLEANIMKIDLQSFSGSDIEIKKKLKKICDSYLGSEDYSIWTLEEEKKHEELVQKAVKLAVSAVAIMIGIIGICNAFSIISNNMSLRRREFAELRSVGLTLSGLNKMLTLEGLFFALKPIEIGGLPIVFICLSMMRLTSITLSEFYGVFPKVEVLIYTVLIFLAILLSYWISERSMKKSNIIESMKDEII